jgi:hypothetical protein
MTKKHFIALAAALRSNLPSTDSHRFETETDLFENIVADVCGACQRANPRFNRDRFESAAGLDVIRNQRSLREALDANERREFDGLVVSDTSEVPSDFSGEVLHINDHGNATLYGARRGKLVEVAACV